jgi:hypothetical protein
VCARYVCVCSNVARSANNFSFHVKANTLCTYMANVSVQIVLKSSHL